MGGWELLLVATAGDLQYTYSDTVWRTVCAYRGFSRASAAVKSLVTLTHIFNIMTCIGEMFNVDKIRIERTPVAGGGSGFEWSIKIRVVCGSEAWRGRGIYKTSPSLRRIN